MKHVLRPQMSESLLPGIISAAIVRVKIVIAAWTPWTVVSRSAAIGAMATFMLDAAKLHRNCATTSGSSTAAADAPAEPPARTVEASITAPINPVIGPHDARAP